MTINPNLPPPVVLASSKAPPPVWPLPINFWQVLPVAPPGFPTVGFPTTVPVFSSSAAGLVPASGAAPATDTLKADASWSP